MSKQPAPVFDLSRVSPSHEPVHRFVRQLFATLLLLAAMNSLAADAETAEWRDLFDGKTMAGWAITDFAGHGGAEIRDGTLQVNMGLGLSGVTYTNTTPAVDYEISLQARKVSGNDFFCGLTVPVKNTHCTLIVGGWGGSVLGISSIDGLDASQNETSKSLYFETGKWYDIRFRITADKMQVWIDEEELIDVVITDRRIEMRAGEIEIAKPFNLSTYVTTAQFRNIRLRELTAEETSTH